MRNIICWDLKPKQMLEKEFNITPLNFAKKIFNRSIKTENPEQYYFHIIGQRANLYRRVSERWNFVKIANNLWKNLTKMVID